MEVPEAGDQMGLLAVGFQMQDSQVEASAQVVTTRATILEVALEDHWVEGV